MGYHNAFCQPSFRGKIPASLEYIREYVIQSAYVRNRKDSESEKTYKKYLYTTMKDLYNAGTMHREMRIMKIWPHAEWETIWKNLQATPVSDTVKSTWYRVIHDIIPTNYRLHRINMSTSPSCSECGDTDTLEHRLTECGEGSDSWDRREVSLHAYYVPQLHVSRTSGCSDHLSDYGRHKDSEQFYGF